MATPTPAVYVLIRHGDQGVGCARATVSAGVVGLYDLHVSPDHRRQGLGFREAYRYWYRLQP